MGFESQYFFLHPERRWRVCAIPDPHDPDVARYAILASLAEALVDACNRRLQQGLHRDGKVDTSRIFILETAPSWTDKIGPIAERLFLSKGGSSSGAAKAFEKRNISAATAEIYRM
ncbi:MAG: hypothetical protein M1814_000606 [Vezdaea aestivalis]|nr:MAG: hypothetical protein M1814_000606 [Vezdaea aestivalis]